MAVINVLKDGTIAKDLTGHVIKKEDCPEVYELIDRINDEIVRSHAKRHNSNNSASKNEEV